MKRRGISTEGPRGIVFRSRLEAKYAYLFDILKWEWDFEPIDLNGYVPDFYIYFKESTFLIEIKSDLVHEFRGALEKIVQSGYSRDILFFGAKSPKLDTDANIVMDCICVTSHPWNENSKEGLYY